MYIKVKNIPKLRLADLLRRKKMTLRKFIDDFGITTFEGLNVRCTRMGVLTPSIDEFKAAFPDSPVNNPTEGVIVVDAPNILDERTGKIIDPDAPAFPTVKVVTSVDDEALPRLTELPSVMPTETAQKRLRKKKESSD